MHRAILCSLPTLWKAPTVWSSRFWKRKGRSGGIPGARRIPAPLRLNTISAAHLFPSASLTVRVHSAERCRDRMRPYGTATKYGMGIQAPDPYLRYCIRPITVPRYPLRSLNCIIRRMRSVHSRRRFTATSVPATGLTWEKRRVNWRTDW